MKFGKSPANSFWGGVFLKKKLIEHNYLKEFERGPPKEHSCESS